MIAPPGKFNTAMFSSLFSCQVVLATKVVRTSAPCASEGLPSGNQTWLAEKSSIYISIIPYSFKPPLSFLRIPGLAT